MAATPLERHRPIVRYDSRERWFTTSVAEPRSRGHDGVIYGRVARAGDGRRWLQYWLYFAQNTQDRGVLRTGRHEGDWELFQLRLEAGNRPEIATLAQHDWAEGCDWADLERRGEAPVVYVANGSHALYSRPGVHDRPWPDPNDEADGRGREARPRVARITAERPGWVARRDRWGGSKARLVPGEQSNPRGPRFQPQHRWDDPGRFHSEEARACRSGPPGRPWQTPLLVAALAVVGLAGLRLRRHLQSPR